MQYHNAITECSRLTSQFRNNQHLSVTFNSEPDYLTFTAQRTNINHEQRHSTRVTELLELPNTEAQLLLNNTLLQAIAAAFATDT